MIRFVVAAQRCKVEEIDRTPQDIWTAAAFGAR
jgi:hypothetical protein